MTEAEALAASFQAAAMTKAWCTVWCDGPSTTVLQEVEYIGRLIPPMTMEAWVKNPDGRRF